VPNWNDADLIASWAMVVLVIITFIADQQQWNYQQAKLQYGKTAKVPAPYQQADLDRGFVTTGCGRIRGIPTSPPSRLSGWHCTSGAAS